MFSTPPWVAVQCEFVRNDATPFEVELAKGRYAVEWFNVETREASTADAVDAPADGRRSFSAPFTNGPAVLYLRNAEG